MKNKLYETTAVNVGGRTGKSFLTDGSYQVKVDTPKEMGGKGDGANPEQLFALGYAACFHSAMTGVKEEYGVPGNESKVRLSIDLVRDEETEGFVLAAKIQVGIKDLGEDRTQKIAEEAHQVCPYSRATQGNIDVEIEAVSFNEIEND